MNDAGEIGPAVLGLAEPPDGAADDAEAQRLAGAAAALALTPNPSAPAALSAGLENRIVAHARSLRPPAPPRLRIRPARARGVVYAALLSAAVAAAAVFGWLAFAPQDPISGQAVALSEDRATGVLLPRFEERPFALVFWGLPEAETEQVWQLWLIREDGEISAGPTFRPNGEGRAAVPINPNTLENGGPPIGFAISLDIPQERSGDTPQRADIRYQFRPP